jgi:hypothetical protein
VRPILVAEAPSRVRRGAMLTDGANRYLVVEATTGMTGTRLFVKLENVETKMVAEFRIEDMGELGIVR